MIRCLCFGIALMLGLMPVAEGWAADTEEPAWHTAVRTDNLEAIQQLVADGMDLESVGVEALGLASAFSRAEIVAYLVAVGVDVNAGRGNDTAIQQSVRTAPAEGALYKKLEVIRLLLDASEASPTPPTWELGQLLRSAARRDDPEVLAVLLEAGAEVDATRPEASGDRRTPLVLACQRGNLNSARFLVQAGANVNVNTGSRYGTPLLTAARIGHADIARLLLESGAEIDLPNARGRTALMAAAQFGRVDVIDLLHHAGADLDAVDNAGKTALDYALIHDRLLAAQESETPQPPETAAEVFEAAGFVFHGEMEGVRPNDHPVQTEHGLVVPAGLYAPDIRWGGQESVVWHVERGEVDSFGSPGVGRGAGWPYANLRNQTTSGWCTATTTVGGEGGLEHLGHAYALGPNDEVLPIDVPRYDRISPCDMNTAGVVVGWYSRNQQRRGFAWSRADGFVDLGGEVAGPLCVTDINDDGMMAGHYLHSPLVYYPRVWLPSGEVVDPALPEGYDGGDVGGINADGVVLMSLYVLERRGERTFCMRSPYLWSVKDGFTPLPRPEGGSIFAGGLTDSGQVLMKRYTFRLVDEAVVGEHTPFVCTASGELFAIPEYPGATETVCVSISSSGHIAGYGRFADGEKQRYIGFVISQSEDAE